MMYRRLACWLALCALVCGTYGAAPARAAEELETTKPVPRDERWLVRHNSINERAKQGDVDLLFIGDSITQGWEGAGKETWAKYYGNRKAMNAGIGGDRTQHVLWRLDNGNIDGLSPKLAVLMIGTNNSGQNTSEDIAAGVKAIVAKLRDKLPKTKVLVLAVFPRGGDAESPGHKVNVGANEIFKSVADGENVFYLDIGDEFLGFDKRLNKVIMPDLLHLSPRGYDIWAAAIEAKLVELLGEVAPNALSLAEEKAGWKMLFDGRTTRGWHNYKKDGVGPGWKIIDGALTRVDKGAGDILTNEMYDAFELSLEYNISPEGNSGLMFHVTDEGKTPWQTGPEIQIQDNKDGHDPQKAGWLYQLYSSEVDATKPPGEWNQLRILITPEKCEQYMNGVKYCEYVKGSDDWNQRVAKSKFAQYPLFGKPTRGYICLQDHGNLIAFRNVKIRPIATSGSKSSMNIDKQPFGTTPEGKQASLFTLTNARGLVVKLTDYGARLVELQAPDRSGKPANVTLGFDTLDGYIAHKAFFGCTTGRYANRIAKGKFTLDGYDYQLATNAGANHLHGGARGFDRAVWKAESLADGVAFSHVSPDGDENFPGALSVRVEYLLGDDNQLRINYMATTDKPTVLNLTNHGYWNLAGGGKVLDHEMTIAADRYVAVDKESIPTGKLAPVAGTPLDFKQAHKIGERIEQMKPAEGPTGYDHCYVLRSQDGSVQLAARVKDPASGRVMEVFTTEPGVQFYTGNYLDGDKVNGGHEQHTAFCLETQHYPDSPNQPSFPTTVLRPGQTYKQTTIHRFSVE
ncbi:MAG: galactose-1-epimerase [Planctomycetes bacterium]|nr:galactose-1-epimerase [Planctomycetota bacterium]